MAELYYIEWVDSTLVNEQVDTKDLPKPNVIRSVGWLSHKDDGYLVISRDDHTQNPDSYEWRGNCAIPRVAIRKSQRISIVSQLDSITDYKRRSQ